MKKFMSTPIATAVLFALAVLLLGFGGVNAIQAAPRIESADYRAQVQLSNINVAIVENGEALADDATLLTSLDSADFKIGQTYDEVLSVRNVKRPEVDKEGEGIDEYVRVTVYRYWTAGDNDKVVQLGDDKHKIKQFINLHFLTGDNGWFIDEESSTYERTVLYYKNVLPVYDEKNDVIGENGETPPFADTLTIDSAVATAVTNGNFKYNNLKFNIKVTADAVQTHNGSDAMTSAWGRTNEQDSEVEG